MRTGVLTYLTVLFAAGCESISTAPSVWEPQFTRFSVKLSNVRVMYDDGAKQYETALSYSYDYTIPDSLWKFSPATLETSCTMTGLPQTGEPYGSRSLRMTLRLLSLGNGHHQLSFSSAESDFGYVPFQEGYTRNGETEVAFSLKPVFIPHEDTLELVWRGDDLDRVLRSFWYSCTGNYTSLSKKTSHCYTGSFIDGPQYDSAAITVKLYR